MCSKALGIRRALNLTGVKGLAYVEGQQVVSQSSCLREIEKSLISHFEQAKILAFTNPKNYERSNNNYASCKEKQKLTRR